MSTSTYPGACGTEPRLHLRRRLPWVYPGRRRSSNLFIGVDHSKRGDIAHHKKRALGRAVMVEEEEHNHGRKGRGRSMSKKHHQWTSFSAKMESSVGRVVSRLPADVALGCTPSCSARGVSRGLSGMTQDMGMVLHDLPPHVPQPFGQHHVPSSSRTPSATSPQGVPVGSTLVGFIVLRGSRRVSRAWS